MKRKLFLFMAMIVACGVILAPKAAMADIATSESFTVTIPEAAAVTFVAVDDTFNSINSSDFGQATNIQARNANVVGNGVVATSTSYVTTNDTTATGAKQFTITPLGTNSDTATIADNGGIATLTVADSVGGASIGVIMRTSGGADTVEPTLGITTPVSFAVVAAGNGSLNIPITSSVLFGAGNKAPLDMTLDIDESTLTFTGDAPGTITFDLTFTVVGVN